MPELPEVEVVRAGLEPAVTGATISSVEVFDTRALTRHIPASGDFTSRLTGRTIRSAVRRGKFLWLPLTEVADAAPAALLVHLGMSGQVLLRDAGADPGADASVRIRLLLEHPQHGEIAVNFMDQRTFGSMAVDRLEPTSDGQPGGFGDDAPLVPSQVTHIARDALDPAFSDELFIAALRAKRTEVKRALLDQSLISGIGNIYADEALWAARVHYAQPTAGFSARRARQLLAEVRLVLEKALAEGGTSFDAQYVNVNGASGYFSHSLNVYGREGKPCPRCGRPIARAPFMNRSSHLCRYCQRLRPGVGTLSGMSFRNPDTDSAPAPGPAPARPLAGRSALITGVSRRRGIGYAIAQRMAELGANVFIHHFAPHDLEQRTGGDDLHAVRHGIQSLQSPDALFGDFSADLADSRSPARLVNEAVSALGRLDILVCNHARSGSDGSIFDMTAERLDAHWQVNARSTLLLTRIFAEQFSGEAAPTTPTQPGVRQKMTAPFDEFATGRVIWMTSGQMDGPMHGEVAYASSKAALAGVTPTVASELLTRGIILNTINPGPVNTGYMDPETTDRPLELHEHLRTTPFGRFGAPTDPARLIAWLATDEGRWVVGQVLITDGGFRL